MTPRERDYVAGLCAARAGLELDVGRPYLLESRLGAVARREGFASLTELVRALRERGEERLVWAAVEACAPARSAFFRDPEVFDALASDLQAAVERGASPRVWSAACGAGQEAYSLAMLLEERGVEGVEILASDVSERRLEQGEAGSYSQFEVQQGLPARRLVRFFSNRDDGFVVEAELRRQIRWERMNLLEPQPAAGAFDLILCRYLLASLVVSARQAVIGSLARSLRPEGRLVLGADERPPAASGLVAVAGAPGVFQRRDAVRAAA